MVATRDIVRGERILSEGYLLNVSEGMKEADLAASVAALTPKDRERFSDLTCNEQRHGPKSAFGIVATNGIPFRHRGKKHGGLFLTTSRVNHACDANVAFKWNPTTERLTIHALRAIKSGEEITYNYGFDTIFCCRAERQSRLQTTFGFVCLCAKCELKGDALRKSEERMEALADNRILAELHKRSDAILRVDASDNVQWMESTLALMAAECGAGHYHGVENFLQCFCEWCAAVGHQLDGIADTRGKWQWPWTPRLLQADEEVATEWLREQAGAYLEEAHSLAVRAHAMTRDIAGDDSPACQVWSDALARGCWRRQSSEAAPPDFEQLWRDGLAGPPLRVALASVVLS